MDKSKSRTTDIRTEAVAGVTTFFTMAYIVVVNPQILADGTGMPASGVLTATVLICFTMTLLTGLSLLAGRYREVHPVMYALAAVSIGLLILEHGKFS